MMSEICATSSRAAMRGATFLPKPVAGSRMCEYAGAIGTTRPAMASAVGAANRAASACNTLLTPAIWAAASAAVCAFWPATRTWMSPPIFCAAATVFRVAALSAALSCSATTRIVTGAPSSRNHLRFIAELRHELFCIGDLAPALAFRRLDNLERSETRCDVDSQRIGRQHIERLLLRLHDVGQRRVARLVQPQVSRDDRGQRHRQRLEATVDLALDDR